LYSPNFILATPSRSFEKQTPSKAPLLKKAESPPPLGLRTPPTPLQCVPGRAKPPTFDHVDPGIRTLSVLAYKVPPSYTSPARLPPAPSLATFFPTKPTTPYLVPATIFLPQNFFCVFFPQTKIFYFFFFFFFLFCFLPSRAGRSVPRLLHSLHLRCVIFSRFLAGI